MADPARARAGRAIGAAYRTLWRFPALSGFVLFTVLALASRPAHLGGPMHEDTGGYLYVGERILEGGAPYVDAAEPKGPVNHLLFALVRLVAGHSFFVVKLTMVLFIALAALALAGYVTRLAGRAIGIVAAGTFTVLSPTAALEGEWANTEQYGLAPMLGAVYFASLGTRRSAALAGALTAAAVLMNLGFAIVGVVVALELLRAHGQSSLRSRVLAAALGACAFTAPVFAWLALHGALDDMRVLMWEYARTSAAGRIDIHPNVASRLSPRWLVDVPAAGLWFAGVVGAVTAIALSPRLRLAALAALVWIVAMWARVKLLSSFSWTHHYFLVLPGVAAGIAVGIATFWGQTLRQRVGLVALVLVAPVWAYVGEPQKFIFTTPLTVHTDPRALAAERVAAFIKRHTAPDERIFVAGSEGQVYWLADRKAPTRFATNYVLWAKPELAAERARDLRRDPPAAVALIEPEQLVDVADDVKRLVGSRNYRLAYDKGRGKVWLRVKR